MQHDSPKASVIRTATEQDAPQLAKVLARAFADDNMIDWLAGPRGMEPDTRRNARSAVLFEAYLRLLALPHGMTHTTHELTGAALWSPPNQWRLGVLAQARMTPAFFAVTGWSRLTTRFIGAQKVLAAHPEEPHYYLQVLGVDPDAQGRGWGSQLLRKGLQTADAAGMPCYLETMNESNLAFYEHHAFRVSGELRLPFTGHRVWLMWRDAQPIRA